MNRSALRVLMVLRAPLGGLYRHVIDLTQALSQRGHKVGIVMDSVQSDAQTDARLLQLSLPPALGVYRFPIPRLIGFGDIAATWRIRDIARRQRVDVLHGHGAKGGFNARLARLGAKKRICAYTPHGGVLNYEHNSTVGRLLRRIEKMLLPVTDTAIFESDFVKTEFQRQIGAVPTLSPVIHNGLAPDEFVPLDPELADFDFAFVGEMRRVKGIGFLLDALTGVTRASGRPATLIIGGAGPEEENIRDQIKALNLEERVLLVGVKPARQVFARARFAIMPSLAESLPYVALEAAAAHKPLIATNVGGVNEIFGPTKASLLPPSDVTALAAAMQAMIDDPDRAKAEMQARLEWISSRFSIQLMVENIENTYLEALERRITN